jgi:hypothetical protein
MRFWVDFKDACRQTANCLYEVKKKLGLGLCRAVPAVTPHLPCRAGRGSPLAGIAAGNVSPAAGRLVAACRTGIKGCDQGVYPTRVTTHGWSPGPGCNPGWLTDWRVGELANR